jgi:hypothetical protein
MNKARFDKAFASFIRLGEEKITPKTFFQIIAKIERNACKKAIGLQERMPREPN